MLNIHYIGNYVEVNDIPDRCPLFSPASTKKMAYIVNSLKNDFNINVVSPGYQSNSGVSASKIVQKNSYKVIYLSAIGDNKQYLTVIKLLYSIVKIKKYITKHVNEKDIVIVYSQPLINYAIQNNFRKLRVAPILEIEELYSTNRYINSFKSNIYNHLERRSLEFYEKFIVCSEVVNSRIKKNGLVCHGKYLPMLDLLPFKCEFPIKILYSGALDFERGIFLLLEALTAIPLNLKKNIFNLTGYFHGRNHRKIEEDLNTKLAILLQGNLDVKYFGTVSEDVLTDLIINSSICVAPQLIKNDFSSASFPSKILEYLSYGKLVVASEVTSVVESPFKKYMETYTDDSATSLLEAIIRAVNNVNYFYRNVSTDMINSLIETDQRFNSNLRHLIYGVCS